MIVTNNPILQGARGKLNDLMVRQVGGKTVVSKIPDRSRLKLTEKQKSANDLMRRAVAAATHITENPKVKWLACQRLNVPPNKVYRAIVKEYIITGGKSEFLNDETEIDDENNAIKKIKAAVLDSLPDAQLQLFGSRTNNYGNPETDWDILILTAQHYANAAKWELQEKLFELITKPSGARVNIILAQKEEWLSSPDFALLRTRVGEGTPI